MRKHYSLILIFSLMITTLSCNAQEATKSIHNGVFQLVNKCSFDVKFDLINQSGDRTSETIEEGEDALYRIGEFGVLVIIKSSPSEDKSNNTAYQVTEKKRYGLEYSEKRDKIILVEYEL